MPKTFAFDQFQQEYDDWFKQFPFIYESEIQALRSLLPDFQYGLEIGLGSGKFALPLGVPCGIEPSLAMRRVALTRGLCVLAGVAEQLPLRSDSVDFLLMVTTICFVDDLDATFQEAYQSLRSGGFLLLGFVDDHSPIGEFYKAKQRESKFYRDAVFYSTDTVLTKLRRAGFLIDGVKQTVFHLLHDVKRVEPVLDGYGQGSFIALRAVKP